jgi:hypothetical protein
MATIDERGLEVDVAVRRPRSLGLASALVVPRANPDPGGQVPHVPKHLHVDADLRDDRSGDDPVDAGDRCEDLDVPVVGLKLVLNASLDRSDVLLGAREASELRAKQEPVMLLHSAVKGQGEVRALASQRAASELGHLRRRRSRLDQCVQHSHAGDAEDVAGDTAELDVGGVQHLEQAVALGTAGVDQLAPVTQQLAKFPKLGGGHEALADEPVAREVSDPLGIAHVGLATWDVLDVARVAHDQIQRTVEHFVHGPPVDPRALHGDHRAALRMQPVSHLLQVRRKRPERPDLLARPLVGAAHEKARHHGPRMHIQSAAPFDNGFHLLPPGCAGGGRYADGR